MGGEIISGLYTQLSAIESLKYIALNLRKNRGEIRYVSYAEKALDLVITYSPSINLSCIRIYRTSNCQYDLAGYASSCSIIGLSCASLLVSNNEYLQE